MDESEAVPARRQPHIVLRLAQWIVAGVVGLFALAIGVVEMPKIGVPDAPVALFWATLALWIVTAIALAPPVFYRLPKAGKTAAYGATIASLVVFTTYLGQMEGPYSRSPEGIAKAKTEALEAAALKAIEEGDRAVAEASARLHEPIDDVSAKNDPKQAECEALVPDVINLSKDGGPEVIEINDIQPYSFAGSNECLGTAITNQGQGGIKFGVSETPQGRSLLSLSFPHGLK